jgi:RNA polymerase sigma-B factor
MPRSDANHREDLVLTHQGLAKRLARRYASGDQQLAEELEQVAALGLVQAARRFDGTRGTAFSTFAVPTIVGELRRYFRNSRWAVHVPRRLQEAYLAARNAEQALARETGRPPGAAELAERLGWSLEMLLDARAAAGALAAVSLDAPTASGDDEDVPLGDRLGDEDPGYCACEVRDEIEHALATLDPSAEEAVRLRYQEELSYSEVAGRIGVSTSYAAKLVAGALHELRTTMQPQAA